MANPLIAAKWSAFAAQQLRFPRNCPDRKRRWHLFATSSLSTASVAVALLTLQPAGPALADGGAGAAKGQRLARTAPVETPTSTLVKMAVLAVEVARTVFQA